MLATDVLAEPFDELYTVHIDPEGSSTVEEWTDEA